MSQSPAMQQSEPACKRIVLVGVGRDGAAFVHRLERLPETVRRLYITSSPTRPVAESTELLRARESSDWRNVLAEEIHESNLLVIVATLTGREGSFIPDALAVARGEGVLAVAILAEPVLASVSAKTNWEAHLINQTVKSADATMLFSCEPLLRPNIPISEAIEKWTERLSSSLRGFLCAAASEDAFEMQFSNVAAALSGHCRATVGAYTGKTIEDALTGAMKQALAPPAEVATARTAVAHLVVGPQVSLDDARRAVPALAQLLPQAEISCGVSIDPAETDIRATIIAGKLDPNTMLSRSRVTPELTESPFFKVGDSAVYQGQNLDEPAFIRANLVLPGTPPRPVPAQTTLFDQVPDSRR